MQDFFVELKKVFIRETNNDHKFDACGYFETILQNKDKLQPIISDGEKYNYYIVIVRRDESDDYGFDNVKIYLQNDGSDHALGSANYYYQITLEYDERHWGSCECNSNDPMYNKEYRCCGMGCDWSAPMVSVSKVETLGSHSFNGYEKDLWKLQAEWNEQLKEIEDKRKQERLNHIQQEIERLQNEQEKLLKTL